MEVFKVYFTYYLDILLKYYTYMIRDWSLITGRGAATKREGGGHVKFYPYEKGAGGGGRKSFSHAEGGTQKVLGSFLRGSLKF